MQDEFFTLADAIAPLLRGAEVYTAHFSGEASDFVRFSSGAVRQAGSVYQRSLTIDLIDGDGLCDLLKEQKIGVRVEMVEEVTVDEPAFAGF